MSDPAYPISKLPSQPLTTTAITPDGTLVDDTVVLVDGNVLVGSTVTPAPDIRTEFKFNKPQGRIKPRR